MDPWLESPDPWPGVHTTAVAVLREQLVSKLPRTYYVDVERRVYLLEDGDPAQRVIVPDTIVLSEGRHRSRRAAPSRPPRHSPTVLVTVPDDIEVREPRLVVRRVGTRELVTVIELLSPANKTHGSHGRDVYLSKRREVLHSRVHLVEIDLLRAGERIPLRDSLPEGDYLVHVSRVEMRPRGEIYAWTVRDEVPEIAIPLAEGDADVTLDLGLVVKHVYDRGGYDRIVDYLSPPDPPLRSKDRPWARKRSGSLRPEPE
jgi:hypothetical protein